MFKYGWDNSKGSLTVEISLIFTMIIMTIFALLFTFLYMQQKSYLVSAAAYAAQQGAELWRDSGKNLESGKPGDAGRDPVGYRIFDNLLLAEKTLEGYLTRETGDDGKSKLVLSMDTGGGLSGRKLAIIGEALGKQLNRTVLRPEITRVRLRFSNNGLSGRLTVEIIQEIKVPLSGLKQFLDGKTTLTLMGSSTATVVEPAEYIRNVDLAIEMSRRLGDGLDLMGMLDRLRSNKSK